MGIKINYTKAEILNALSKSVSFKDASIYLGICLTTFKNFIVEYDVDGDLKEYYKTKYQKKRLGGRCSKKPTREKMIEAVNATLSNKAAARYLGMDYRTLRKHAKGVFMDDGTPILDANKNYSGKGIPKFGNRKGTRLDIEDLKNGNVCLESTPLSTIKFKLIESGYLKEECNHCGFHERRVVDYKVPLILHFKDGNKYNWELENLEMLCYNCFYLMKGELFTQREIQIIETEPKNTKALEKIDEEIFELDEYQIKRLKELNLWDEEDNQDEHPEEKLISRR
jgi:5-methylcytosine-specific restriction endonuclease McrA